MPGSTAVGVDVGTTGCKVAVVSEECQILASTREDYILHTPEQGAAELDPESVWQAVRTSVRRAVGGLSVRPSTLGISVAGEVLLPLDSEGRPIRPAITSIDTRCTGTYAALVEQLGSEILSRPSGLRPAPHYSAFRWKWFSEAEATHFARTALLGGHAEWIATKLGVTPAIDPSLAARTLAYDVDRGAWDVQLLQALGIDPELMPTVVRAGSVLGEVPEHTAEDLGLRTGTRVMIGGLDQACAAFALDLSRARTAMLSIGTTAVVGVETSNGPAKWIRELGHPSAIPIIPHVRSGSWLALAGTPAGGAVVEWISRRVLQGSVSASDLVDHLQDRRTSVLAIPHLGGSRSAFADPFARGAVLGLTFSSGRDDLVRAFMDGVAYEIAVILERLKQIDVEPNRLLAVGGGSLSDAWLQPFADVCGIPVESARTSYASAVGAAAISMTSANATSDRWLGLPIDRTYRPRLDWSDYHAERLAMFKAGYESVSRTEHLQTASD